MKVIRAIVICAALGALPAFAAEEHAAPEAQASAPALSSEGEIRKVDKGAGKVTIKHGPLENLGMGAMTMVFRVKDAAWLDQMKEGDRIRFLAEKVNGALTVVRYQPIQ